jgi:hypothetical protein
MKSIEFTIELYLDGQNQDLLAEVDYTYEPREEMLVSPHPENCEEAIDEEFYIYKVLVVTASGKKMDMTGAWNESCTLLYATLERARKKHILDSEEDH